MRLQYFQALCREYPALLYGIHFLLGSALALFPHWSFAAVFILIWLPVFLFNSSRKIFISTCCTCAILSIAAFLYAHYLYPPFDINEEKIEGTAYFSITSVKESQSPFFRSYHYHGKIKQFHALSGEKALELPCEIFLPLNSKRPPANCDYFIRGTLCKKSPRHFVFKPAKGTEWLAIQDTSSLAELRFQMKLKFNGYLKKWIPNPKARSFLTALTMGDLDDRTLSLEFSKLGLQHVLGVSGFQFVLLAALFSWIFRFFLPFSSAIILSLICLTAYYFLIGNSPPVQRAWIAIFLYLISRLTTLRLTALNALGTALLIQVLIDPLEISTIGFQLSFLCTAAILLLYPSMNTWFSFLLPQRSFAEVKKLKPLDQHGYIFSALIRQSLALNLSVHLFALPVLLALFHKFPLFSFLYNLFFPFWLSITFLLFILSAGIGTILPFIGSYLHLANTTLIEWLLAYSSHPPAAYDFALRIHHVPFPVTILSLTLLFLCTLALHHRHKKAHSFLEY